MADGDTLSGLARVRHDLIPRTLSVEAGALATRSNIGVGGASALNALASNGVDHRTIVDRKSLLRFSGAHGLLKPVARSR